MKPLAHEGMTIPHFELPVRVRDESIQPNPFRWDTATTESIFAGKRVVIVALPGAFTPTCSTSHLPGYEARYDEIIAAGVDEVHCVSVNDPFVMFQWAKAQDITKVKMLPDGNATFTELMGMLVTILGGGMGSRSWRYSMVVNDGVIEKLFVEPGMMHEDEDDPFVVSDVDTMLQFLQHQK